MSHLSIAWWNTGLSPVVKPNRASYEELAIATDVILYLLFKEEIDFLALGEVSNQDILVFQQLPELQNYEIKNGVAKSGRVTFDTCFIYRPDKIEINSLSEIDTGRAGTHLKIAQQFVLLVDSSTQPFYVFVSHWPSRRNCPENHPDRALLGISLRREIDNILSNNSKAAIILLGDYNDEPFNSSLADQLMATRDKKWVKRNNRLLYNPFWRDLSYSNSSLDYAGTYYYKSGQITKWHTFDQIIFSSTFLNSDEWLLNETATGIVHIPDYLEQVTDRNTIFDHLPVKAIIEKV